MQPDAVYQAAAVPLQALCSHAHESPQRLRTPRRRMELPLKGLSVPEARCLADGTTGFHSGDDAAVAPARLPRALAVTYGVAQPGVMLGDRSLNDIVTETSNIL